MRTVIYGPPGTGKTYTFNKTHRRVFTKTDPDKIGYFTFSKKRS